LSDQAPLEDLTKLGMFFGRISEVHLTNLKSFPWIFFNDLSEVKLDYNFASSKVSYDLSIGNENDNLDKRFKALESSVRQLFWKEVQVKISINNKKVYPNE